MKRILAFVLVLALALPVLAQSVDEYRFTLVPRRPTTLPANSVGYLLNDGSGGLSWGAVSLTNYVTKDGLTPLTADWSAGNFNITAKNIIMDSTNNNFGFGIDIFKYSSGVGMTFNTAVGVAVMQGATGGSNVGIGLFTLQSNTGSYNQAIGRSALGDNTGSYNESIGNNSLRNNTGSYNQAMGASALYNNVGSDNIGIGANTLNGNHGNQNTGIGSHNLYDATGNDNTAIGFRAGYLKADGGYNTPAADNVYVGSRIRSLLTAQTNEVIIGAAAVGAGSNTVTLGNTAITKTILRGEITAYMINNLDSDTDEVDSYTWAGGYGMLVVACTTDGATAIYRLEGTTLTAISANAAFDTTKDHAATYNVYFETGALKIQNKVGDDKAIKCGFFGL